MSEHQQEGAPAEDPVCVVCFKGAQIWSIGVCDHAVCFECSTRMRVLCRQTECPICRRDMPKVIFTTQIEPYSILFPKVERKRLEEKQYGIYFCNFKAQKAYNRVLEHRCLVCSEEDQKWLFKSFNQLKDHMRREHELFYCDICTQNLKIFSFERRSYTRQELALHRRKGDPDNTSHRGHPLCEFCDTRFMDSDELFRHLRRYHLFCHLCDADGKHQYYNSIEDLKKHFKEEHHLCEEGDCRSMPLTAVYRSDIDLKAHIAQEHSRHLNKSANKQARTLELEFTLAPRPRSENLRNKRYNTNDRREDDYFTTHNIEPGGPGGGPDPGPSRLFVNPLTPQDFPALGNATPTSNITVTSRNFGKFTQVPFRGDDFPSLGGMSSARGSAPAVTITTSSANRNSRAPEVTITRTREDFPSLNSQRGSTVSVSVNSKESNNPKVSIQVNHGPKVAVTTHISSNPGPSRPSEAFPALGKNAPVSQAQWVQPRKKNEQPRKDAIAPCPQLPPNDMSAFPTLNKAKKTSSVTVPVNNNKQEGSGKSNKINDELSRQVDSLKMVSTNTKVKDVSSSQEDNSKNKKKKKGKSEQKSPKTNITNSNNSNQNGMVKKRSELKIGTLKNMNKGGTSLEDSSSSDTTNCNSQSSQIKENDALSVNSKKDTKNINPPPGFDQPSSWTSVKPPPGFNISNFPTLGTGTDLTFTNSTGQSYSILPGAIKGYRQPENFNTRNQNLIKSFQSLLNSNEIIRDFKSRSEQFRKGTLSGEKYLEHCREILGNGFDEVFPELLVLLPDIDKQQELYKAVPMNAKFRKNLLVCDHCKQVVFQKELAYHYNQHAMDNHFPNLDCAPGNAWGKYPS